MDTMTGELREAAREAIDDALATDDGMASFEELADAAIAATEPLIRARVIEDLITDAEQSGAGTRGLEFCNWGGTMADWLRAHLEQPQPERPEVSL